MTIYKCARAISAFIFKIFNFYKVYGRENIPCEGVIVCANHTNFADPIFAGVALDTKVRVRYMAKKELFKNKFLSWFLGKVGAFPVNRGVADLYAIKEALKTLSRGERLVMFPEGTRNSDDGAKAGVGMLALRSDCALLPVYITPGKRIFKPVRVIIGKPYFPKKPVSKPTQEDYQRVSDECLEKIYALGKTL